MGSGASREELATRHVLIIGGGYAGIEAAAGLAKAGVPFTLVDPKEFMHHCCGALRAAVSPGFVALTAIPFKDAYGDKFVQGKVISLDVANKKAALEGGGSLAWSHCLVAVGSLGPAPGRTEQLTVAGLKEEAEDMADCIRRAGKVVIIGGGAVGFELAGEIKDKYKDKAVTIVSSSEKLVFSPNFPPKFYTQLDSLVEAAGVKVVIGKADMTGVKVNTVMEQIVKVGETTVDADLVITCIGAPPNKSAIDKLVPTTSVDEQGRIKVDEFLGVEGCPAVYALGDCVNTPEHKMAAHAMFHSRAVVANIVLEVAGKPPVPYKQKFDGLIIPFGAYAGAGTMNGWSVPGFIVTFVKSGDLFSGRIWDVMGLKNKMPDM